MIDIKPELVIRKGSKMTIALSIPTAVLPQFFIGARIKVMGLEAEIESMTSHETPSVAPGEVRLTMTLLIW